jgi:AraC-like DNA-binding protein
MSRLSTPSMESDLVQTADPLPAGNHITILRQELEWRKEKNPRFSLRRFARLLQMDPSALCRIFAGKQELSLKNTRQIIQILALSDEVSEQFRNSVIERVRQRAANTLVTEHRLGLNLSMREDHESRVRMSTMTVRLDPDRVPEALALFHFFRETLERIYGASEKTARFTLALERQDTSEDHV